MGMIFEGLLLVFLHIKINGFDLLPDFLGYILIWQGMKRVPECTCWKTSWAAVAAVASVAKFGVSLVGIRFPGVLGIGVSLLMAVLEMAVTFDIVRGTEELEQMTGTDLRTDRLRKAWYLLLAGTAAAQTVVLLATAGIAGAVSLLAAVLALVGIVCYLVGAYKTWKAYDAWREEQTPTI